MIHNQKRAGFSMLELVFVIVILGIISSLASEIIARVYQSYIVQRASNRSSIKTEIAAMQIANRLSHSIPNTVIGRVSDINGTYRSIENLDNANYSVLEWVGSDIDGFQGNSATGISGWSGFIDINSPSTTKDRFLTLGSNIQNANAYIQALSTNLNTTGLDGTALFFPGTYNVNTIGYNGNISGISIVSGRASPTIFTLYPIDPAPRVIKEHYKLAWSAYAIVPTIQPNGLWTLNLHYDLQPWNGVDYNNGGQQSILLRNVSVFQFSGNENSIRFKLCQQEWINNSDRVTTCKEKAVIR
ncbi:MAG: prepilin-type N-terminal cleavage/methylation domain-containing protein [Sulfurovum sp.]